MSCLCPRHLMGCIGHLRYQFLDTLAVYSCFCSQSFYAFAASQIAQSRDGEGGHNEGRLDDIHSGTRPQGGLSGSQYKYYFNIGSIESFERKLEDAQDTLGVDPHDYVPVTYVSEMSWQQELLRLAPTILLIAGYIYFSRRMQGWIWNGWGFWRHGWPRNFQCRKSTSDQTEQETEG